MTDNPAVAFTPCAFGDIRFGERAIHDITTDDQRLHAFDTCNSSMHMHRYICTYIHDPYNAIIHAVISFQCDVFAVHTHTPSQFQQILVHVGATLFSVLLVNGLRYEKYKQYYQ